MTSSATRRSSRFEAHGAGVEAGDLEQVLDELLEAVDVGRPSGRAPRAASSGISSRRLSSTSTEAASVISGDRSSWLTSDANRASRSMRSCSAGAMSLNDAGEHVRGRGRRPARAGCRAGRRRWPAAAGRRRPAGCSARRLAHQPEDGAGQRGDRRRAPSSDTPRLLERALTARRGRRSRSRPRRRPGAGCRRPAPARRRACSACGRGCPSIDRAAQRRREARPGRTRG